MKVEELILLLQKFPKDTEVLVESGYVTSTGDYITDYKCLTTDMVEFEGTGVGIGNDKNKLYFSHTL